MVRDPKTAQHTTARHIFRLFVAVSVAGLATAAVPAFATDNVTDKLDREVTLACNVFPPSKIANRKSEPGFDVEILRAAFAASGVRLNTPFYPWKRAHFLAEQGLVDGLCSCSYLPEREATFEFSAPIGLQHVGFFVLDPDVISGIETLDQALGLTIGVVAGYNLEKFAREAGLDTISANSEKGLFALLRGGRIDAIYAFHETMTTMVKNHNRETNENLTTFYRETAAYPYFSCLSKKAGNAAMIADLLNSGLEKIKTTGHYNSILERYGVLTNSTLQPKSNDF